MKKRLTMLAVVAAIALLGFSVVTPAIPLDELKHRYASTQSRFAPINGMDVHYRDEGTGPVVLLIHGTSSSLHTWDAWTQTLAPHFRVIRFDLPAFGLTGPNPAKDYSIAAYVDTAVKLLDHLGVKGPVAVAGNSLGGDIAWRLALHHPERVSKLILVDAAGYPRDPSEFPFVFKLAGIPGVNNVMPLVAPRFMYVQNVHDVYGDIGKITDPLIDRYRDLMLRDGNRQAMIDRINTPFIDEHDKIKTITQPTLIMWGRQDRWIPPAHAERFKQDLPNATLRWYDAGHVPMEELGDETARDALGFL